MNPSQRRIAAVQQRASLPIAVLALIIASSSGLSAYAAAKITTAQIKDGAVTSAKIRDRNVATRDLAGGAVRSSKVADGSIQPHDLSAAARTMTWVNRPGSNATKAYDSEGVFELLPPMTISVPTSGMLDSTVWATSTSGVAPAAYYVMVDYSGNLGAVANWGSEAQLADLYSHLGAARDTSGYERFPLKVTPGKHTIRVYGRAPNASSGDTTTVGRRVLTVQFVPGVSGPWQPYAPLLRGAGSASRELFGH